MSGHGRIDCSLDEITETREKRSPGILSPKQMDAPQDLAETESLALSDPAALLAWWRESHDSRPAVEPTFYQRIHEHSTG